MSWRDTLGELRAAGGKRFWRGLDELLDTATFRAALADEFPGLASGPLDWERRDVLRCLGASLALSGLAGCDVFPDERAMPYVRMPEGEVPGRMRGYATATVFAGYAQPVIGLCNAGRPTKLEGNSDHPMSRGTTDAFTQAALLDLYDPDRATGVTHLGRATSWEALDQALAVQCRLLDAAHGRGFALLTGATSSPTTLRQIDAILARWPEARWFVDEWDLRSGDGGTTAAFGRPLDRLPLLDAAHVTVAFDAAPLDPGPGMVAASLGWSARRRAFQRGDGGSALFVAEPTPTLTGGRAEHRLVAEPGRIPALVAALAGVFGVGGERPVLTAAERAWIERAAKALASARGRGLVLVGGDQPAGSQALGFALDERLGNLPTTSRFIEPVRRMPDGAATLAALAREIAAGRVTSLIVLDANPAYLREGAALDLRLPFTLHAGTHADETARACQWHVPLAHALESWSDARAVDGTLTIVQPLVRPFFGSRGRHALLAALAGDARRDDHAIVRETWGGLNDAAWGQALVSGVAGVGNEAAQVSLSPSGERVGERGSPTTSTALPLSQPASGRSGSQPDLNSAGRYSPDAPLKGRGQEGSPTLLLRVDPTLWDGRFANNPWAQELPQPFTTLTWGNALLLSPRLAAREGVKDGDVVRVSRGAGAIEVPVLVQPGQAPDTLVLHIGHGRRTGTVAEGSGVDALAAIGNGPVTLEPTGRRETLGVTQPHHAIDGKDLVRVGAADDTAPPEPKRHAPTFWDDKPKTSPSWGMAIDLDLCTGCGACVTACMAENNIPTVGREQVANGREMHWLRVDRYSEGDPEAPRFHNQPVPCMHCEDAPCEMGCPVNAAVHSPEGLNLQVYNRCIGTRTCSSYCPYKVRRFNWYDFTGGQAESIQAQRNPNVTVRMRGVMEKCTYCIQRISAARIDAKEAGTAIKDGAVKTACQQVCPVGAISFGDIADPAAAVVGRKASPRDYTLLEEANTRPRTSYLARIRKGEA